MTTKLKFKDSTAADNGAISSNLLGLEIPLTAQARVRASYSNGKIDDSGTKTYDLDGYQVVGIYDLSKRTHVYGAYGMANYDSPTASSDVKITQMGFGLRHSF
jgi:predicted porin